jgi:hypothetical protein
MFLPPPPPPNPNPATVGDVCGWMATDFSLVLIPVLTTHVTTVKFFFFPLSLVFSLDFFYIIIFQMQSPQTLGLSNVLGNHNIFATNYI